MIVSIINGVLGNTAYGILKSIINRSIGDVKEEFLIDMYNSIDDASSKFFKIYGNRFGKISNSFLSRQENWEIFIKSIFYSEKEISIDRINPNPYDDSDVPELIDIQVFTKILNEEMKKRWRLNEIITKKRHMAKVESGIDDIIRTLKCPPQAIETKIISGLKAEGFSDSIVSSIEKLNVKIKYLTDDQFKIIKWLKGQRRAAICGTAGSGKTLVAIEKACRLDFAGLKTLMLCHSPHLADYMRQVASGTDIEVHDFSSWIKLTCGEKCVNGKSHWTHYEEPSKDFVELAFDRIKGTYDAIIVDEGQDFRDDWWIVVEAALVNPNISILYIFYDDNQALLPFRSEFPKENDSFSLSKNCRNAGNIYEIVRSFHPHAPETEPLLKNSGVYMKTVFSIGDEINAVSKAISKALAHYSVDDIVILTTEPDPASNSILNESVITVPNELKWQDGVHYYLEFLLSHFRYYRSKMLGERSNLPKIPKLSNEYYPSKKDIDTVVSYVDSFRTRPIDDRQGMLEKKLRWQKGADRWYLSGKANFYMVRNFFKSNDWSETLPEPDNYKIVAIPNLNSYTETNTIRLLTTSSFKGLEAISIILFSRTIDSALNTNFYVGASRATHYLHSVVSYDVNYRLKTI